MIFLILLLIVILAVFCGILYVRHKAKEFSRTIFGTEDLSDGIRQMKREYASTPKSVSGMTNLLLPKIVSDFPDFEYDEMKERAENTLTQYLRAVTQKNTAVLTDGNTELKQQLENHIQMLFIKGLWEHFDQIKIHRTEIHQYKKADGRCIITFQSALECFHYITDTSSVIEGSKEYKYQTKYNTDLIYIQDRNLLENELDHALGINCPNCGAPLSSLGAKKCEYCGTPVIEINIHAWSFSDIKEMN